MSYTSVKKILVDNDTNEIMKYKRACSNVSYDGRGCGAS